MPKPEDNWKSSDFCLTVGSSTGQEDKEAVGELGRDREGTSGQAHLGGQSPNCPGGHVLARPASLKW